MRQSRMALVAAVLLTGLVVAVVSAQESRVARRPGAGRASSAKPGLVERLKSVRQSVVSGYPEETDTEPTEPLEVTAPPDRSSRSPRPIAEEATEPTPAAAPTGDSDAGNRSVLKRKPATDRRKPAVSEASRGPTSAGAVPTQEAISSRRTARVPKPQAPKLSKPQLTTDMEPRAPAIMATDDARPLDLSARVPALRVEANGPSSIIVGRETTYQIQVYNEGELPARDLLVRVTIPDFVQVGSVDASSGATAPQTGTAGARTLAWTIPQVDAGRSEQLSVNVVTREARAFELGLDWSLRPISLAGRIHVLEPKLEMVIEGPSEVRHGDSEIYKIIVSNPGTGDAENVTVRLGPGSGAAAKMLGAIPAGEQREIELELTARDSGTMRVTAQATADGGLEVETDRDVIVRRARLEVAINAPRFIYAGTSASYEIRVANRGDAAASGVVVAAKLPRGASEPKATNGSEQASEGELVWSLASLEPGAERVFNIQCVLGATGDNAFVARVQDDNDLVASQSATTTVQSVADLKLVVNDPKGPIPTGEEVQYEITVTNRGSNVARQIRVVAQFSEGIEPIQASGHPNDLHEGQVVFHSIDSLAPGETVTLKVSARAEVPGNHRFRAEVKCVEPETRLVAEDDTQFFKQ